MEQSADDEGLRLGPPPGSRIVLVGGGGGIGRAVTAACVATGLRVAVLDLPRSLERHPPPEGVLGLPLDATDERMVDDAFGQVGVPPAISGTPG